MQAEEALGFLEGDFSGELTWPWQSLTELVGPPLAGELWFIGARPGNGKTTILLNWLDHLIHDKRKVLYIGMEMSPARLRAQWASWACGYDFKYVARKQWHMLPPDARDQMRDHIFWQNRPEISEHITFADDERITLDSMRQWIKASEKRGLDVVIVDHLHRMSWGGADATSAMAEGVVELKTMAKERGLRMVVAAQLKRPAYADVLDDFMPPAASAIKQTGATEQEADTILLLHKGLRQGVKNGELQLVRQGQLQIEDVARDRVMMVRVGKCRIDGDARDRSVPLFVHKGRLYGSEAERSRQAFGEIVQPRQQSNPPANEITLPW
jgi:replicative DNA helicase